ncbi:hypothetical protein [Mycolicibacterium fluoranthenivorans]|uniref:Liporotein LppU n=1 Tax=Mycolicibacterium fluoranthenivorans TaxID=258505 RepID=A0A1G4VTZ5_9MYCO|nr:hypothetical protein [Mycolicibacterium fluoranthenivorans]SCX11093.1 hypothetical protein SAMN02799620_01508 [Mycolicibacterium fluoranthenivorans]
MAIKRGVLLIAVMITASACGGPHAGDTTTTSTPAAVDFSHIPGQYPPQATNVPGESVAPVGACVSFDGPSNNATLRIVECGSPTNGYTVIQRVYTPDQCAPDVAQKFYMNADEGQFTACLDYAWKSADCLSIGKVTAIRAKCEDTTMPNREKPLKVILNTTTNADCPTGGFPHPVRKFTVCTETQ